MELKVTTWGDGPRTAVLVHGFSDDAETWWRVGPAIAELGFTVLAPDLRGHGRSPRADTYSLEALAGDLLETLPASPDVVLGHSLGAIVLGVAAPRLRARRLVYLDPSWLRSFHDLPLDRMLPSRPEQLPPQTAAWSPEDVAVDLASNGRLDPAVGSELLTELRRSRGIVPPPALSPGTVVVVPENEPALPLAAHDLVRSLGYEILTHPGVGHVMHRDDLPGFLELLRPRLLEEGVAA